MDKQLAADSFAGIDVSKDRVDVPVRTDGTVFACKTDPQGLADLVAA